MSNEPIQIGPAPLKLSEKEVRGEFVVRGSEEFYRIENFDRMSPFFMSVVSGSDHWLFISSNGGLTAGRKNADHALFPYATEDKIRDGAGHTGSRTILRLLGHGKRFLWEPFSRSRGGLYDLSQNLYKNVRGNKLLFEEVNHDLELVFRYLWTTSDRFGFVKHSELENQGAEPVRVEVLDGIENILPWGLAAAFQTQYSCLGDAYKQNELEDETGLATFALSSQPGDSPQPAEALRATVCWSTPDPRATRLLSSLQLDAFRRGESVRPETRICGRRGAYFVQETLEIAANASRGWLIVADVDQGLPEVAALKRTLAGSSDAKRLVLEDVDRGSRRLTAIVARADGLQRTGDRLGSAHHFANVLFNVMRGGVFESAYSIEVADLTRFVRAFNRETWKRRKDFLAGLGEEIELHRLRQETASLDDPDLLRLVNEYLPISFSRRHGDPSRPWNQFSINVRNRDGSKVLDYQGNWRDIFQNWEALCFSFPEYLEGVIRRFVDTTTADGYNPYRVTRDGYDWEAPDPDDPWAHFGYWGDHQIIYLLKFLEWSRRHHPAALEGMLGDRSFVYADVPYDLKPYRELLTDPRSSLTYNDDRAESIRQRVEAIGFDGRYLPEGSGGIRRVNLTEKLLVPLLAKVSSFVPGAGIWLNTQRPEWNDANNALAGFGASMVTVYYTRRYVSFCLDLLESAQKEEKELSHEVADWLDGSHRALEEHRALLAQDDIGDADRKGFLDAIGRVAEEYRTSLYRAGLSGRTRSVPTATLSAFLRRVLEYLDQTIRLNQRDDGLYHAYNVLEISSEAIGVARLNAMLEGQVAVLSSGALSPSEALAVARALRQSAMYREDQHSYLLYPDRRLPGFLEKNRIPAGEIERSRLLERLVADGNTDLVERDVEGGVHFHGLFRNIRDVEVALERLKEQGYESLVEAEADRIGEIFESVFKHKSFTGRSGTFYGYEGLGCIYWHMVSKLLLAAQENCLAAETDNGETFRDLAAWYYDVRAGLGFNKEPQRYGAFPTDPYSHTPGFAGARQPGMTGQVKEEILTRFGELGLSVRSGRLHFSTALLRRNEFLTEPEVFDFYDVDDKPRSLDLEEGALAFTYCQVPFVYRLSSEPGVRLHLVDGSVQNREGLALDRSASREIFRRTGSILRVEVSLEPGPHSA